MPDGVTYRSRGGIQNGLLYRPGFSFPVRLHISRHSCFDICVDCHTSAHGRRRLGVGRITARRVLDLRLRHLGWVITLGRKDGTRGQDRNADGGQHSCNDVSSRTNYSQACRKQLSPAVRAPQSAVLGAIVAARSADMLPRHNHARGIRVTLNRPCFAHCG